VREEVAGEDEERIAMISNFSMPVEELERHRLDRHRRHREQVGEHGEASEIEIGIPVSIRPKSSAKMIQAFRDRDSGKLQHD